MLQCELIISRRKQQGCLMASECCRESKSERHDFWRACVKPIPHGDTLVDGKYKMEMGLDGALLSAELAHGVHDVGRLGSTCRSGLGHMNFAWLSHYQRRTVQCEMIFCRMLAAHCWGCQLLFSFWWRGVDSGRFKFWKFEET